MIPSSPNRSQTCDLLITSLDALSLSLSHEPSLMALLSHKSPVALEMPLTNYVKNSYSNGGVGLWKIFTGIKAHTVEPMTIIIIEKGGIGYPSSRLGLCSPTSNTIKIQIKKGSMERLFCNCKIYF